MGMRFQTLLGVTGSGKTYTMANVIARLGRPAFVMAPNKTLAAQLYAEFREFFPDNAVEYFVSYYDYYQPEAYVPSRDLFIEKDSSINEHIEQMRLSATKALLEREDCVIVATVSAIYGIGDPVDYHGMILHLRVGERLDQRAILRRLTEMQYTRNEMEFKRGVFRVKGDVIDIFPAESAETAVRVSLFDDEVESAVRCSIPSPARCCTRRTRFTVYPSSHYVTARDVVLNAVENIKAELAERLEFFQQQQQAGGGPAHRAAHPLRPGNAGGTGLLQGHRELLAAPVRAQSGGAAAHPDRLPAAQRGDVHRRIPRHRAPGRRHVQGRPGAQGKPGGLRLPPALGPGQPAPALRRIRKGHAPDRVRLRHARALRGETPAEGGGTGGAPHRPGGPGSRCAR
jgi:hypothetical protein